MRTKESYLFIKFLLFIDVILFVCLLWVTSVEAQTTTTTTLSPFHDKFISLCKVDTSVLKEPYKTQIRNLQIAKGCP